jgi:anti-sigma28 factor (negative regulator of flagellin synthesis)
MYINSKLGGVIRPEVAKPATPNTPAAKPEETSSRATPPKGTDQVQISDAGRALAAREGGAEASRLSPERVAELRQRVLDGAYNSVEVVDEVARRILSKGDL